MTRYRWISFAMAAGVALSVSAIAASPAVGAGTASPDAATHNAAVSAARARLASARAAALKPGVQQAKAMGQNVAPGTPLANPYRAYPPSCAAYPLPDEATGPTYSSRVALYTRDPYGNAVAPETVTITVWRIACSSSGNLTPYNTDGGFNAMTLMRIDRDPANENNLATFPTFPFLQVTQGSIGYTDAASVVRAATEPNTNVADGPFDAPIYSSATYVLENYNYGADYNHLYSYAFNLLVTPYADGVNPVEFQLPNYSPTTTTYPDAYNPLYIDGYAAAQWVNTSLNQGLIVQVAEQYDASHPTRRQLGFDLLTEDLNGNPLWLIGNAAFEIGTTSLNINTAYLGSGLAQLPWGTANVQIQDCNHLNMTFSPNAGLPSPIPSFSGLITYSRLFSPNGMLCE